MEKKLYVPELGANVAYDDSWPSDYVQQMVARLIQEKGGKASPQEKPQPGIAGQLGGILSGIIPGAIKGVSAIPEGIGGVLNSDTLKQFGRDIRENPVSKYFTDVPEGLDGYGRQVGEIGGQLLTMLAPGSIARGPAMLGRGLSAATGMSQAAAEQVQRAAENRVQGIEVTPDQETSAARVGSLTGLLDLLPYERFLRGATAAKGLNLAKEAAEMGVMKQVGRAAGTGAIEGGTEAGQQYLQNLIEGGYNASQSQTEGIGDNAAAGFGAGALLELLTGVRARGVGKDVMARRERVPSQPVAPLSGVDSVAVRSGEGGDPLIELLAGMTPEQPTSRPSMSTRENYSQKPKSKTAEADAYSKRMQQLIPDAPMPVATDELPVENYGQKQKQPMVTPPSAPAEVTLEDVMAQPVEVPKPKPGRPAPAMSEQVADVPVTLTDEGVIAAPSPLAMDQPGAPRFSIDEPTTTPTTYTVNGLRQEIEAGTKPAIALDVFNEMKALGVDDIMSTRLIDNIPNAQGSYANRVVQLALNGKSKADLLRTLNHEAVHGMKEMGLFNDAEWDILNKSFNPNTSLTPREREEYTKLYKGDMNAVNEEAVARGIERYAAGQINATPEAISITGKALGTIDRLGNVLRGKGFQNADDVLKSFRSGDIGSRPASVPPPPPTPRTLKDYEKGQYDTSIQNGQAAKPVAGTPQNLRTNTVGGRSTELSDYLSQDEPPEDAGEVERLSVVPQLPVAGGTVFAKPDERTGVKKAVDAFVRKDGLGGIGLKFRQNVLDMWAGVSELGRRAGDTSARTGSEAAVRNADAAMDMAAAAMENGAVELVGTAGDGYFRSNGDTANAPATVFKEAYQAKKLDRLFHYLAAERADVLRSEGREKKITPQQVAEWKAYGQDPEIAAYAKRWKTFNDQMVNTLQKSGRINAETAAKFKKDMYLPFYRVVEGGDGSVNFQSSGSTMASAPRLDRLKGSELDIGDPTDNIVRNINALTSMAMKNVAMQRVARDGLQTGYIKQVPKPVAGKNNIKVWVDGKEKHFEVLDPILYNSVTSSRITTNEALKVAGTPANLLRFMVTHDPVFMINNPVRDSTMAWLQGYTDFPMQKILQSAYKAIRNKPDFEAMKRAGVVGSGIRGEGGATGTGKNLRDLYADNPSGRKEIENKLDDFSTKSEAITRQTVYDAVMERTGGDEAQAQYEARELLNFGRRGSSRTIQVINALIPFQNAAWQGADVLYRTARGRGANKDMQKQLGTRALTMAALSSMYAILASEMPAWQNATDEERDANWFIPMTNGDAIKIKIPFEAGYVAKVVPERLVAMYMGHDTGREFVDAFRRFLQSTLKVDVVPQFMKPASEVTYNYSTFRGKSIEPEYMRDREKSQRFDENTSELAKKIGEHTDTLSPLQIDHLLRGYGGALGIYATQFLSLMADPESAKASMSMDERMPHDLPVLGRFFQRPDSGKELATYYETADKGTQAKNALKAGLEPTEERVALTQYEMAQGPIYKRIQAINKQEKLIREAMKTGGMEPGDARAMLRDYRELKLELARQANELSRGLR